MRKKFEKFRDSQNRCKNLFFRKETASNFQAKTSLQLIVKAYNVTPSCSTKFPPNQSLHSTKSFGDFAVCALFIYRTSPQRVT